MIAVAWSDCLPESHRKALYAALFDLVDEFLDDIGPDLNDVGIVEVMNGGSRRGEDDRARELASERELQGTGGSDAHFVSAIGTCLTDFPRSIGSERELVEALREGGFRPVWLEDTRNHHGEAS